MVKLKVTRNDGYTIEAEGPADELVKLGLVPWYSFWWYGYNLQPNVAAGGGVIPNYGTIEYKYGG